jgi:hypothetical protein
MRLSFAVHVALALCVTACSSANPAAAVRRGSGGAASGGAASGGAANAGAPSGGAATAGSSAGGAPGQAGASANAGATAASGNGSGGATSSAGAGGGITAGGAAGTGTACGYKGMGHVLNVGSGITLCLPPQTCLPETCPPTLGSCVNGQCVFNAGYEGLQTLPEAWTTHYCDLQSGACQGVDQLDPVLTTAQKLATKASLPLCKSSSAGAECVGIVASPPMMVGNREKFGEAWGLGLTEPSGLCYEVTGPGGSALLAITDRCGGYCECPSAGVNSFTECGLCKEAPDLTPLCECRGDNNCSTMQCDWCAANNHPHFDVDDDTFNHLCGDQAIKGSCQLTNAKFVACMDPRTDWPPGQ